MAENESFFKKVVRFVANPSTDWNELSTRQDDSKELELERSELKAMIERKRRNDFVRKREFDTLRRVRRDGLSPEQLATLGSSSRLDDSDARAVDGPQANPTGVKAKIDAIEQQMVGSAGFSSVRTRSGTRSSQQDATSTLSPGLSRPATAGPRREAGDRPAAPKLGRPPMALDGEDTLPPVEPLGSAGSARPSSMAAAPAPFSATTEPSRMAAATGSERRSSIPAGGTPSLAQMGNGLPPLAPMTAMSFGGGGAARSSTAANPGAPRDMADSLSGSGAVEVSEVVHDPELDEAVIAFANADFAPCEATLQRIIGPEGARAQHAETWLVLFDLYRATGQQQRFESLALDYAQRFGWSAPQWYSLPQLVAEAAAEAPAIRGAAPATSMSEVGWMCPTHLDIEAVAALRSKTLQLPLPWVLDWSGLTRIDAEAAMQLSTLLRLWAGQALEMRWNGGGQLFAALQDAAPTGMRDADPVFWLTRMDALRLANRPDQFDEAAIDYCVTYEVSPPSWESTRCKVTVSDEGLSSRVPTLSAANEVSSSFMESSLHEDANGDEVAMVELSGQLVGDISATLQRMQGGLGKATIVSVSCMRLIRVDFIAAGDLLNWVLARRQENRAVHLVDTHRLVALFFGAMGINEHARVQLRKV